MRDYDEEEEMPVPTDFFRVVNRLRREGYFIAMYAPEELGGLDPLRVGDELFNLIDRLKG
jgi:hypothetical protein